MASLDSAGVDVNFAQIFRWLYSEAQFGKKTFLDAHFAYVNLQVRNAVMCAGSLQLAIRRHYLTD
jgi:hypothetical protein